MHTKPRSNSHHTDHGGKTFLQKHSGAFLGLFLILLLISMLVIAHTGGLLDIQPTELILKPQGCAFLQHYGIRTEPLDRSGACRATVMFRSAILTDSLYLDDERIELARDEIIAFRPSSADGPWTAIQIRWAALSAALIVLTVAMAVLNEIGSRRRK